MNYVWSLDLLDLSDYDPNVFKGYVYNLLVFDNFCKIGWKDAMKLNCSNNKKDSFENTLISSRRKLKLIETDVGKEYVNKIFI